MHIATEFLHIIVHCSQMILELMGIVILLSGPAPAISVRACARNVCPGFRPKTCCYSAISFFMKFAA